MVAECTQSRVLGAHIRFLAVSEVGFLGHRKGLKLIFSNVSLFKLLPCHIHTDIFSLNENIHSCIHRSRDFEIINGIRHVISDEMPVNITSSVTNKICFSDKLYQLVTSQKVTGLADELIGIRYLKS